MNNKYLPYRLLLKVGAAVASFGILTGCIATAPVQELPLAAVIEQIRSDLKRAQAGDPATGLPLKEITLVLKVTGSSTKGGTAEVTVPTTPAVGIKATNQVTGTMENTITLKWAGEDIANPMDNNKKK